MSSDNDDSLMRVFFSIGLSCAVAASSLRQPLQQPTCAEKERGHLLQRVELPTEESFGAKVRGRSNLPSGSSTFLPEHIPSPSNKSLLMYKAKGGGSLESLAAEARALADSTLTDFGVVLFRDLPIRTGEDMSRFVESMGYSTTMIQGGGTERSVVARGVRSASDEPANHTIEPHQDMAHNPVSPEKLVFFMLEGPPEGAGGETVLTDMRAVTRAAQEAGIIDAFEAKGGVMYKKTLWSRENTSTSFTWQRRFFTEDKGEVERVLNDLPNTEWSWDEDTLHYENILPATASHPKTGERVFFNGIHTNHRDYFDLAPHIDTSNGTPYDTFFGDGDPIPDKLLDEIRGIWWSNSVAASLETGDVAILDNVLKGHGRLGWTPHVRRQMLIAHLATLPSSSTTPRSVHAAAAATE